MRRLALFAVCLCFAAPALAGQPVTLKADTTSPDGIVTLGDLFDGAGAAARTPVASRNAASVVLNAAAVQLAARRAGLDWANAEGLKSIVVRGQAAATQRGAAEVLTYARSFVAGEIVGPADLVWGKGVAAPADAPVDAAAVIGLAAKRPLRAGAAVSVRDVGAAQVIKAGEMITVTFQDVGISLTLLGKAMSAAGVGDTLGVMNTTSKKVIQAVATGPGQAVVGPAAENLKAAGAARFALR